MEHVLPVMSHALLITGFVAIIMLVIEYVNVISQGAWQEKLVAKFRKDFGDSL